MKISILCSSKNHPVNDMLDRWSAKHSATHTIESVSNLSELSGGDILFLISCSEIVGSADRCRYGKVLVIHASDLPRGRGWSPHVWEIIGGADALTISLLEAEDIVDSGAVWARKVLNVPKHALYDEINAALFLAESELMDFAVEQFKVVEALPQDPNLPSTYYRRRTPEDSEIDPEKTLASQFDLIRVSDADRFPAFFKLHGHTYKLTLEKMNHD
ncbi:UDP-glucuronic acid dehydrogenase [Pseudomonas viridiflava]|uniref:UDP-glucuronic acid dehydrogenase n=1 Tax=Pseudomonas viridiflava TaxID=33069 RepID=UPI000F0500B8|nr:UDP-glucuronic acid dehydrogenase [Pseudomonas viridiflava]